MNVIRLAELRDTDLSVDEVLAAVADPTAGGVALFAGTVRDHDHGRTVTALSYTAHPSATVRSSACGHWQPCTGWVIWRWATWR